MNEFYVDDLLSGADSIPAALKLQTELISLLACGSFQLRQWSSNAPEILEAVPLDMRRSTLPLSFSEDSMIKTLGFEWHPTVHVIKWSWSDPVWLHEPGPLQDSAVVKPDQDIVENERKITVATAHIVPESSLLSRWSSLRQLPRVTAWCLRFGKTCKTLHTERVSHPITVYELHTALLHWVIIVQSENFSEEIHCLKNDKPLPLKSRIASLSLLLYKDRVLRVGGRLQKVCISEEQKHPVLLPPHNPLTKLIILHRHLTNLHAGLQLVQLIIQQRFWILRARDTIRHVLRTCVTCCRQWAATTTQIMVDLLAAIVHPSRPFLHCGVY
ncbi:hypothetical protein PR048_027253 [Dryococelus australis]|uniref:Integrase zinc-binding domain-containing protein n=1 Tax=Dryococelus australis TaxID=614101 RepID=A0ABQ9GEY0_9NEOP|nr:hypothetical protein PR048_027253 [Dryococelus australis]